MFNIFNKLLESLFLLFLLKEKVETYYFICMEKLACRIFVYIYLKCILYTVYFVLLYQGVEIVFNVSVLVFAQF